MKKRGFSTRLVLVVLAVTLLAVFLVGWLVVEKNRQKTERYNRNIELSRQAASKALDEQNSVETEETQKSPATASSSVPEAPLCAELLAKEVKEKDITYAKGQILVRFANEMKYSEAKVVLDMHGLVVRNEIDSERSFTDNHYVTASVVPNQEITKVCEMRGDSRVKYAGLDVYISLHE